jgi:hypothetical protein
MPRQTKQRSKTEIIRRNKYFKKLKADVEARVTAKLAPDLAVAHTLADMRHICDDLQVSYGIADRIGGIYYAAEIGGSLR